MTNRYDSSPNTPFRELEILLLTTLNITDSQNKPFPKGIYKYRLKVEALKNNPIRGPLVDEKRLKQLDEIYTIITISTQ